jgi:hypothetical protein
MKQDQVVRRVGQDRTENPVLSRPLRLVDDPTALARGRAAEETAEWHRVMTPGGQAGEITCNGLALSRPRRGFESRWGHQIFLVECFERAIPPVVTAAGGIAARSLALSRQRDFTDNFATDGRGRIACLRVRRQTERGDDRSAGAADQLHVDAAAKPVKARR